MTSPCTRSITICSHWAAFGTAVVVKVKVVLLGGEQLDEAQLDEAQLDEAQLDEALGGKQGFCGRLDKLLAALLPAHAQRARLECGTVL